MNKKPRTPEEMYGPALQKAQLALAQIGPTVAAARGAVSYTAADTVSGRFQVPFFGINHYVSWPEGAVQRAGDQKEADIATRILLLHYLLTADGTAVTSQWIAFRNLPGGLGYHTAFQQRASLRLAGAFGANRTAFDAAAKTLGGERLSFGDASFLFRALPRVWLAVVLYLADEEFSASANVLFDAAASHYLPTEDLAVLGGMLAGRLVKAAQTRGTIASP